jgi:hypothetical protein
MNSDKFKEIMTMIVSNYDFELTAAALKIWWAVFKDYDEAIFERAVLAHIACPDAGMFAPKPANIMKHIIGNTKENAQALDDRASLAWSCVEGKIRSEGSYWRMNFDDALISGAIQNMGGWKALCACTTEELVWKKKDFCNIYEAVDRSNKVNDSQRLENHSVNRQPEELEPSEYVETRSIEEQQAIGKEELAKIKAMLNVKTMPKLTT